MSPMGKCRHGYMSHGHMSHGHMSPNHYMACGKHFLIETEDSEIVEEDARKQLSHELSAEGPEEPTEVSNHVTMF